jgi:hypothetical protein
MQVRRGRFAFLLWALAAGVMLSLAVYQVPQPWRALLVAWLLVGSSLGALVARLVRHHYAYRAEHERRYGARPRPRAAQPAEPRFEGLEVVTLAQGERRYTIR